jgi:hypothetical protein
MTDRPEGKPKLENLELNRETILDLTEAEAERVEGGALLKAGQESVTRCGTDCCSAVVCSAAGVCPE